MTENEPMVQPFRRPRPRLERPAASSAWSSLKQEYRIRARRLAKKGGPRPISVRALIVKVVQDWLRRQPAASCNGGEIVQ